jgi:hypothetical protein
VVLLILIRSLINGNKFKFEIQNQNPLINQEFQGNVLCSQSTHLQIPHH